MQCTPGNISFILKLVTPVCCDRILPLFCSWSPMLLLMGPHCSYDNNHPLPSDSGHLLCWKILYNMNHKPEVFKSTLCSTFYTNTITPFPIQLGGSGTYRLHITHTSTHGYCVKVEHGLAHLFVQAHLTFPLHTLFKFVS